MKSSAILAAAFGAALFSTLAFAGEHTINGLSVTHPMAYETPKSARAGAGYLSITNENEQDDRLIEVRADFPRVMLHTTQETDGIARMVHLEAIDLPAGQTIVLEPGGHHVMFMGLDGDPFEEGEEIPATLVFEKAGELDVVFKVEKRGTEAATEDHSGHGEHSGHKDPEQAEDHSDHSTH